MPDATDNSSEQQEVVAEELPVAQDANEVREQPNDRWWENSGDRAEVH